MVLELVDVSKTYRIYPKPRDRILEVFSSVKRHQEICALKDVTYALSHGRSLGLIGVNGAGKSTLLKLIAKTSFPTSGEIRIQGRVAAILELGMGFHGEFSGRDNAVLNGAMLGLTEGEIRKRLPSMVEFAELGDFIDRPVKTYSTGMAMRLAFAVATHVDPDILIIDEALAVGDGYFQKKCVDKIRQFREMGRSILLCTHALYYISQLCDEALWLDGGMVRMAGKSDDVVVAYETYLNSRRQALESGGRDTLSDLPAMVTSVTIEGEGRPGDRLSIHVQWKSKDPDLNFRLGIVLDHSAGLPVFSTTTPSVYSGRDHYEATLVIDKVPFLKGSFDITVFLVDEAGLNVFHQVREKGIFQVKHEDYPVGFLTLSHRWLE